MNEYEEEIDFLFTVYKGAYLEGCIDDLPRINECINYLEDREAETN